MVRRLILILMIALLLVIPALAQEDEPLQLGVQGVLASGSPVSGEFEEKEGMSVYAFEGVTGDVVSLAMNATDDELDPYLLLIAADGTLLGANDDASGLNAALSAELPADGLYFVLASTYRALYLGDEDTTGSYDLVMQGATASGTPVDDLLLNVDLPALTWDSSTSASLTEENPVYLATLEVQDSITMNISAVSADGLDTLLYVFDSEGQRIGIDDDSAGNLGAALNGLSLDEPGKYLVVVTHRDYLESTATGSFDLSVSRG